MIGEGKECTLLNVEKDARHSFWILYALCTNLLQTTVTEDQISNTA